ncbi:unnamed protein product, partial [Rotaria sp. Silwood1]
MLRAILFLASCTVADVHYSLYYSDFRQALYSTFDCLYASIIFDDRIDNVPYTRHYHLTPYCQQPDDDDEQDEEITNIKDKIEGKPIIFSELNKQKVTSEQLLL